MRSRSIRHALPAGLLLLGAGIAGCAETTRYAVLSKLFDGVPPPVSTTAASEEEAAEAAPVRRAEVLVGHGPYAARQCGACHVAGATNALVEPAERLCQRCHEIDLDKRYVHGPLAAGGCGACHDPHSSPYRYLLISEADDFCLSCHDGATLSPVDGHAAVTSRCTVCHEPHMSDRKFLLR